MLKALFLDMDETLCDTTGANLAARDIFRDKLKKVCGTDFNAAEFASAYLEGIYKRLTPDMQKNLLPINDEEKFRTDLLAYLFKDFGCNQNFNRQELHEFRIFFDSTRLEYFDFFPGVKELLENLRQNYTLVVITNGPVYSQRPKINHIHLKNYVDYIIVGGEEPEEKPHRSIFEKACRLAKCNPDEAIHFGDSLEADIRGAAQANIKSVWISSGGEISEIADHSISYFIQCPEILRFYET